MRLQWRAIWICEDQISLRPEDEIAVLLVRDLPGGIVGAELRAELVLAFPVSFELHQRILGDLDHALFLVVLVAFHVFEDQPLIPRLRQSTCTRAPPPYRSTGPSAPCQVRSLCN